MQDDRNGVNCPNGHGPLKRQPGWWSLTGWSERSAPEVRPDGTACLLRVYWCSTCRLTQLYNDDLTEDQGPAQVAAAGREHSEVAAQETSSDCADPPASTGKREPMTEREIQALAEQAMKCSEAVIEEGLREGTANLKDKAAGHAAISAHATSTLTVMLAAVGGAVAYAARLESAPADPVGLGALVAAIYLMVLSGVLVRTCMMSVKAPAVHQEPKNIVAFPSASDKARKAGELAILQARIAEQGTINSRRASWLNRVRSFAIAAPLIFAAGVLFAKLG